MYYLIASLGLAALYGEAAFARGSWAALVIGVFSFALTLLSLTVPPRLFRFSLQDVAPVVLTRLVNRAALGSALIALNALLVWLVLDLPGDAALLGELYLYTLLAVFIYQALGETIAQHVIYLQQTKQYNSNQLAAVILLLTLLLFVLVLYFLAFDLSRPPELHAYRRDLIAITVALVGFGRAVYLMAHH